MLCCLRYCNAERDDCVRTNIKAIYPLKRRFKMYYTFFTTISLSQQKKQIGSSVPWFNTYIKILKTPARCLLSLRCFCLNHLCRVETNPIPIGFGSAHHRTSMTTETSARREAASKAATRTSMDRSFLRWSFAAASFLGLAVSEARMPNHR